MGNKLKVVVREENVQENVTVKLTDLELLERSKELASTLKEIEERDEQFKFVRTAHQETVKDLKISARQLSRVIGTGKENRFMKLIKKYDYEAAEIHMINPEDGQVILVRDMTDEEKQLNIVAYRPPTPSELDENQKTDRDIADVINLETHRKTKRNAIDT
ncbi:MAG: hypothetical protein ACXVCY_04355 [Pseudobdellovibrionaceae bacterium]